MDDRRPSTESLDAISRYRGLIDDPRAFDEALARPLPTCVWTQPLRVDATRLRTFLEEDGHEPTPLTWVPGAFRIGRPEGVGTRWWYLAGLAHVQEEASQLPVTLLDVRPGHRVLDLCAAPGGKTAQIAVALGGRGTVVANDVSLSRMRSLRDTIDRLGLTNVTVTRCDGGSLPRAAGSFDRVLVDAPCSGEGTLRRPGHAASRFGERVSREYRGRQVAILRKAVQLCRAGGRVVYSTCTFAPEENEAVVDTVLGQEAGRGLRLVEAAVPGLRTVPGVTSWNGERFDPSLERTIRLWPHHNDTGGFFVAVIEKDADDEVPEAAPYGFRPVDDDEWRPHLVDRLGIDPARLSAYRLHRRTQRGPHLVAADHAPPARPEPETVGIRFMKTRTLHPKLTTPGATVLGPLATRNVVDLEPGELDAYLARRPTDLGDGRRAACDGGTGYVLVRHRGHGLGLGLVHAGSSALLSLYPKRWAREARPRA